MNKIKKKEYVTPVAFPRQQRLREHTLLVPCTYIACLVCTVFTHPVRDCICNLETFHFYSVPVGWGKNCHWKIKTTQYGHWHWLWPSRALNHRAIFKEATNSVHQCVRLCGIHNQARREYISWRSVSDYMMYQHGQRLATKYPRQHGYCAAPDRSETNEGHAAPGKLLKTTHGAT